MRRLAGALCALLASSQDLGAQADSMPAVRAALRAQQRFEGIRRSALPVREAWGRARCDVQIGPYCYWHDPDDRPPRDGEPARVTAARGALLRVLDSIALRAPHVGLVTGQRVRYRLETHDVATALRIAGEACAADGWWCEALSGYAHHVSGAFGPAAAAFDRSLAAMDSATRCVWIDPSPLLPPGARARMARLPCGQRVEAAARVWWLSAPLLSSEVNDFRTEFLARRTVAALEARAPSLYDGRWNRYAEEMLLRFGWPVWWTRERGPGADAVPRLIGHERAPGFAFVPAERLLLDAARLPQADDWAPRDSAPPSRYAPDYATAWLDLPAQVARFVDGDDLLVLAAFAAPEREALRTPVVQLAATRGAGQEIRRSAPTVRRSGVITLSVPRGPDAGPGIAAVELRDSASGVVAVYRDGLAPLEREGLSVSDLLVHRAPAPALRVSRPERRDIAPLALAGTMVRDHEIGIYWEVYADGAQAGPLRVALTLERAPGTWLTQAAERARLAPRRAPVRVGWEEAVPAAGVAPRSVILNAGDLADGVYDVRLEVSAPGGRPVTRTRRITLRR